VEDLLPSPAAKKMRLGGKIAQPSKKSRSLTIDEYLKIEHPTYSDLKKLSQAELESWFKQTSFGCMSNPLVKHFEPAVECLHKCSYCYVNGYVCGDTRTASAGTADKYTPEQRADITRACAAKLFEKLKKGVTRPGQFPFDDGMKPELHFSISTDFLQPNPDVQNISYQVMKAWLEAPGNPLVSLVSKGIPCSADMRTKFLALFKAHPDQVSYQCTCASVDREAQKLMEPGAPEPEERFKFLEEVIHFAGVKRVSLRMNPLVPTVNDAKVRFFKICKIFLKIAKDLLAATLQRATAAGVKRAACSYMYGSPVIFRNVQKFSKINLRPFMRAEAGLAGGTKKFQVNSELRKATTEWVRKFGSELGIVVSSCGCDAKDLYGSDKCGISWRSGGPNLESTGGPSFAEAKKIQAEIEKAEQNSP